MSSKDASDDAAATREAFLASRKKNKEALERLAKL